MQRAFTAFAPGSVTKGSKRRPGRSGGLPARARSWRSAPGLASLARGAAECAAWIGGFVAFGLLCAAVLSAAGAGARPAPYPAGVIAQPPDDRPPAPATPRIWLVDGYNVLHAGVLRGRDRRGWWKAPGQERLLALAATFDDPEAEIWVIFDRRPDLSDTDEPSLPAGSRVRLVYAESADDWVVRRVRRAEDPSSLAVVTADRQVQGRARHAGGHVVSPLAFLARCDPGLRGDGSTS